jgi:hypothetical protein
MPKRQPPQRGTGAAVDLQRRLLAGNAAEVSRNPVQNQVENRAAEAVAELVHGCERACFDHYFETVYPREVRERAAALLRFAERIDRLARTGRHSDLDFVDIITRELDIRVYKEWAPWVIGRRL